MSLEDYQQELRSLIASTREQHEEHRKIADRRIAIYDQTLKDRKSSEANQVRALVGKVIEIEGLERTSMDMIHLNLIAMLANHVQIIAIEVATAIVKLEETGDTQKKDLEALKKTKGDIEEFKQLLQQQYEKMKQTEESRKKDLSYVL